MSVLEDFYYGELNPVELCSKFDDELKNLMKLKSRNEEKLILKRTKGRTLKKCSPFAFFMSSL